MYQKIKKTIIALIAAVPLIANAQTERLFEYPTPPESLETLGDRTTYLVQRFWDKCNVPSALSQRDAFKQAFTDYVSFMPYADSAAVHQSVNALIAKVKDKPDKLLTLAEIAEETLYNEDAEFISDEIFLPFAKAVASNKKLSKAQKARLAHEASVLEQSQVGMTAPDFTFTKPDGSKQKFSQIEGGYILLFFNDPECEDCMLARVRLSADHNLNQLIKSGRIKVVSIYPDSYSKDWASSVSNYNPDWIVGACADIDDHYDLRNPPVLYYLNDSHKILSKTLLVDNLLTAFRHVNEKLSN